MRTRTTVVVAAVAVLAIGGLTWPRTESVVPEWTVTVKTADGRPVSGVPVLQAWRQQTVQSTSTTEIRETDATGKVVFPARYVTSSALGKALGAAGVVVKYWFNASFGPYGQVIIGVDGRSHGCERLVYAPELGGPNGMSSECIVEEGFSIRRL